MNLPRTPILAAGLVLFAGAIGAGSYVAMGGKMPGAMPCPGGITGASIGGPFELTDHTGARASSQSLAGKPSLVYFGYATCPDVCPMELAEVSAAVEILQDEHDLTVRPVFITVDPERDTVEKVAEYASFFHDDMVGLTGTPEEISKTAKAFRVYYNRVADPDFQDGYSMDHSNIIYLLDDKSEYVTYYKGGESSPENIAEGVACHLG
jgi:protein SCO1/2